MCAIVGETMHACVENPILKRNLSTLVFIRGSIVNKKEWVGSFIKPIKMFLFNIFSFKGT